MAKRNTEPSNSIQAHLNAFRNIDKTIEWPECRISDLPKNKFEQTAVLRIFHAIICAKPKSEWIAYEIEGAAVNLAILENDLNKIQKNLTAQGYTVPSPNNSAQLIRNPLLDAMSMGFSLKGQLHKQLGLMFTHRQVLKGKTNLDNLARAHSSGDLLLARHDLLA